MEIIELIVDKLIEVKETVDQIFRVEMDEQY